MLTWKQGVRQYEAVLQKTTTKFYKEFTMKKSLLLAGVAVLFSANAYAVDIKPYVGLDYVYSMADIDKQEGYSVYEEDLSAFAVSAGARFHPNFGVEAFYQQSEEGEKTTMTYLKGTDQYKAYGIDVIGYFPVMEKLELVGSLGVARYNVDAEVKIPLLGLEGDGDDKGMGYRLGAGAQYNFNDNIAARAMVRYVDTDIDGLDNIVDLTLGIRYTF